jgi:glycosyltransferase involved in cell wall biosynthesis
LTNYIGIGYGYSNHQQRLHEALVRAGVEMSGDAKVAVHLTTPDCYNPIPGAYNILYTMYECQSLPKRWIDKIQNADLIVVPCTQNKYLFKKYTKIPVEVCTEGVETDKYKYYERTFPKPHDNKHPFIYYWFGATNPRKGTEHVIAAWELFNKKLFLMGGNEMREKFVLVMKTTQESDREAVVSMDLKYRNGMPAWKGVHKEILPAERINRVAGNAIVDTRRLPVIRQEYDLTRPGSLLEYYHAAHCFIFPTRGEGFGLTLAEAMSTGCPVIYTPWSGPVDFCDDKTGYPLKFTFSPVKTIGTDEKGQPYISHETTGADPDIHHIVRRMIQVWKDYDNALIKGKAAAERIRQGFTWDISAGHLIDIIEKYTDERLRKAA